jgi:hypothetical protein
MKQLIPVVVLVFVLAPARSVCAPLSGTYSINPQLSATAYNFQDFSSAITFMTSTSARFDGGPSNSGSVGVSGPVTFEVANATYYDLISIGPVPGASALNTITFRSQTNIRDSVILYANTINPAVTISGSYISFRSMTFLQLNTGGHGISFAGMPAFDTIYNCKVTVAVPGITNYTVIAQGTLLNGICLRRNLFSGSYYGISINSFPAGYSLNCTIDSNIMTGASYVPFYNINQTVNTRIRQNSINIDAGSGTRSFQWNNNDSAFEISGNTVSCVNGSVNWGIYYCYGNASRHVVVYDNIVYANGAIPVNLYWPGVSAYVDVYNNSLSLGTGQLASFGACSHIRVYNNTIAGGTNGFFADISYSNDTVEVVNNAITPHMVWALIPGPNIVSDYNNSYGNYFASVSGGASYTLSSWRLLTGKDKHSLSYRPGISYGSSPIQVNLTDSACWSLNGRGIHVPWITADAARMPRPVATTAGAPDIGAFEFTPAVAPPAAIASPATPSLASTQAFTFGGDTVAKIAWPSSGSIPANVVVQAYTGTNPPQTGNAGTAMNAYWNITVPAGTYNYTLSLYYKDPWIGTVAGKNLLSMAQKSTGTPWTVYGNISPTPTTNDTSRDIMTVTGLTHFSAFTGTNAANPLPLRLLSFTGRRMRDAVVLEWSAASPPGATFYEIERATDLSHWEKVGEVTAQQKTCSYAWYDVNVPGLKENPVFYYRLKIADSDNGIAFSDAIAVTSDDAASLCIFPNPSSPNERICLASPSIDAATISVSNITGKAIETRVIKNGDALFIELDDVPAGVYFVAARLGEKTEIIRIIRR